MKEKIIQQISLDIAFMESSCDIDKVNIAFDSIVDRIKEHLSQPDESPSAEEWLETSVYGQELDKDEIKALVTIINEYNQCAKQSDSQLPDGFVEIEGCD